MAEGNGGDVRQDRIAGNGLTGLFTPLEHLIQFPGVVGYHGVGEQRQCAADHDFLVPPAPAIEANGTGVNDTLELVDGFTAGQNPVDAASKRWLCCVVAQVNRIPQLPELRAGARCNFDWRAAEP